LSYENNDYGQNREAQKYLEAKPILEYMIEYEILSCNTENGIQLIS